MDPAAMSDVLVKPAFQSTYPDTGDATKLGPTAWNAARLLSGGSDTDLVTRDSVSATGASWLPRATFATPADVTAGVAARILTVSTAQSGTPANTNETDLWTYPLPANTLSANGRAIRVTAWGTFASNANTKSIKAYFGATGFAAAGGFTTQVTWEINFLVVRTGAAAQIGYVRYNSAANICSLTTASPAETMSGGITVKVTGQNGTANANDIVLRGALVELL
jgi:hypothetical protein